MYLFVIIIIFFFKFQPTSFTINKSPILLVMVVLRSYDCRSHSVSRNIALESEWNVCCKIISVLGKTVLIILDCLVITETDHESYVRKSWFSLRRRYFKGILLYLYQCKTDAAFPFAQDVTMVWLALLPIFTAISTAALQNVSQFPGYKAILHQLKYAPSFWTLIILLTVALLRYVKLFLSILCLLGS